MFAVLALVLVLFPLTSPATQPACTLAPIVPTVSEAPILVAFSQRVDTYMRVHNDVERRLGPQRLFDDPEDLFRTIRAMQAGIRAIRPDAGAGTIFTDDVSELIRERVQRQLVTCQQRVEDVLAFINEERAPNARTPAIYRTFPWSLGSAMWPTLIPALPPLPDELQYRFVDRDLVLIDTHADMVVDILVNALPAPRAGGAAK